MTLIFLSKEEFKFLKVNFLKRVDRFFRESPKGQSLVNKQLLAYHTNKALSSRIDNHIPFYEPTNIVTTHNYLFWSLRRVKEYCRDFLDDMEQDNKLKQAYRLMYR
ncbi:MAG: hypothetical protein NC820_05500 [Candidatus Omnitrophica bacterium]|nr:hypothetical protein [Candidatus Omnitrophota bacterium]